MSKVRPAEERDAAAIAAIYNEGIEDRVATFETTLRTPEDMVARIRATRWPLVVVECAGEVIAWAGASEYRAREAYAGIGEFSVYTARSARRTGAGRKAMTGLIEECRRRGLWKLLSRIFPENTASRALCKSLGFREVGTYERHGRLDGVWRDCIIVELSLG